MQRILQTKLDFIFIDGHSVDRLSTFYYPDDVNNIESLVDRKAISSKYWNSETDLDLKRRKEAEFLLAGDLPPEAIAGLAVVANETAETIKQMLEIGDRKIIVRPDFYFL